MKQIIKRAGILFGIFLAAVFIYIFWSIRTNTSDTMTYSAMSEAELPVVYTDMYGRRMNPMFGYRQNMGNTLSRDSLTILPQDRQLEIDIVSGSQPLTGVRYEIRSLDLDRLVENTTLNDWEQQDGSVHAVLPIQNLITKDREYLLTIELSTGQYESIYYYTRIVWPSRDEGQAQSMIDLAVEFSTKTFSYDQARDLVTYLETNDSEDNSTFGRTTIRSSFSQLTWGRLKMQPAGEVQVTLKELDGIMGCVKLVYPATRTTEDGRTEYYEVEEAFTMKWNAIRTYMMDYERTVNQIVSGEKEDFSGKRIMLGITNDDEINVKRSSGGQVLAYLANRDLWTYHQKEKRAVKVFSFRGSDMTELRDNRREHSEKILRVTDDGDMDFLVYGYQNRGNHEGESGIVGYHYDESSNGLQERFFIPVNRSFTELQQDLSRLTYCTDNDMLYLYLDHTIYGIDLKSNESMVVADALEDKSFAVSADQARVAWVEGGDPYASHLLHLQDLETGEKLEIRGADETEYIRALGFVGRDLVYGMAKPDAMWVKNGRLVDLPMYAVEIMNDEMQVETRYEKPGYYVAGVNVDDSRVHLSRVTRTNGQDYAQAQEDTIVCNQDVGAGALDGIGWYASSDKERVYFVQTDSEIRSGRNLRVVTPKRLNVDDTDRLELSAVYQITEMEFFAYGGGRLLGVTTHFTDALQMAYNRMGFVTDRNGRILWNRVNRNSVGSVRDLGNAIAALERHRDEFDSSRSFSDGVILLDARGCSLMQMLYFAGQNVPVIAYTGEGEYLVLVGFDQYNASMYNPATGETFKVGLNDSTAFFESRGNDFICALLPQ
jgi:hypothetical protein